MFHATEMESELEPVKFALATEDTTRQATKNSGEYTRAQASHMFAQSIMQMISDHKAKEIYDQDREDFSDLEFKDFYPEVSRKIGDLQKKWNCLREDVETCIRDFPESRRRIERVALDLFNKSDYHSGTAILQGCGHITLEILRSYRDMLVTSKFGKKYAGYRTFFRETSTPAIHFLDPIILEISQHTNQKKKLLISKICLLPTIGFEEQPAAQRPENTPRSQHDLDNVPRAQLEPEHNSTIQLEPGDNFLRAQPGVQQPEIHRFGQLEDADPGCQWCSCFPIKTPKWLRVLQSWKELV